GHSKHPKNHRHLRDIGSTITRKQLRISCEALGNYSACGICVTARQKMLFAAFG
ncbi:hypothetical protein HAX54_000599, partial [Datura stramonium]|nr:hypothetical protein [Datura stramonium]